MSGYGEGLVRTAVHDDGGNRRGRKLKMTILAAALLAALVMTVGPPSSPALGEGEDRSLMGSWQVTVSGVGPPIQAMVTAAAGGGLVETSEHSVTSPRRASPGHGAWAKTGGRTYRFTFREFVANQDGSNLSMVVVRADAVLSKSGDEFISSGTVEVLNGAGHVVFSAPQTGRGVRITADDRGR